MFRLSGDRPHKPVPTSTLVLLCVFTIVCVAYIQISNYVYTSRILALDEGYSHQTQSAFDEGYSLGSLGTLVSGNQGMRT